MKLLPMTQDIYPIYLKQAIKDFAEDKVQAKTWNKEEALALSKASFRSLLPEGLATKGHYLLTITLADQAIGYTWIYFESENTEEAFVYDFLLVEDYRGKGYGQEAMQAIKVFCSQLGATKLSLHVFGHNQRALHVYEKVGFQITDYSLSVDLV